MWLKAVEVGVVVLAGIVFAVWQFQDLRRAKEESKRQQAKQQQSPDADEHER